jgi:hypothetical protein
VDRDQVPNGAHLELEQERLLDLLVEAKRNSTGTERQFFSLITPPRLYLGGGGNYPSTIAHPGIAQRKIEVTEMDAEALFHAGFLRTIEKRGATTYFDVTHEGIEHYENLKASQGSSLERVEETQRRKLLSEDFLARHRDAYDKWAAAEALLWQGDSPEKLSQIGLLCRECLILFTDQLVEKYQPHGVTTDKAKTTKRLSAVVSTMKPALGKKEEEWSSSLFEYWAGVSGLVQRVTHAAEKQGEPIVWNDARRVVFQTLTLLYEVDDFLSH